MPYWMMTGWSLLLALLGVSLGLAANGGLFGAWAPFCIPVAVLFAGLIGIMTAANIRQLEQRVRDLERRLPPNQPPCP